VVKKIQFYLTLYIKDRNDKKVKKIEKEQEIEIEFPKEGKGG
jgi:hypothetical protein